MATRFELVLPAAHSAAALAPIGELVMAEIDEWHQRLNRFAPDSWVSHANRTAASAAVRCDEDVWDMLVDAHTVWRESGGAFDITRGHGHALILDPTTRTVRFGEQTMAIDLGGIAKGHAIDCCARLLRANGVTSAFLHGGTSSGIAIGLDPSGQPWHVDFQASRVPLRDLAFSVSDAQARQHIVDPRSGVPVEATTASVAVTGPSARLCDAWSTAYVVMGTTAVVDGHTRSGQMIQIGGQSSRHG
jgi:thiamine biosynthesis lipoprotein